MPVRNIQYPNVFATRATRKTTRFGVGDAKQLFLHIAEPEKKNRHHIVDEPRGSGTSQINQQQPPTNWTPSRSSSHYHMPRSFFQTARGNVHTPGIRQQAYTMPQKPLTICQLVATLPVSIRGVETFPLRRRKASAYSGKHWGRDVDGGGVIRIFSWNATVD